MTQEEERRKEKEREKEGQEERKRRKKKKEKIEKIKSKLISYDPQKWKVLLIIFWGFLLLNTEELYSVNLSWR